MALLSELWCPWPVDEEACGLTELDPGSDLFIRSVATASSIMTRLSAYTVGLCETELRPLGLCRECRSWCCGGTDGIYLRGQFGLNVWDVTRVRLGDVEYPDSTWRFERETRMLWRALPDVWPSRDDKGSHAGAGAAFVVDVTQGVPPDPWALDVAARLTRELYMSCTGGKCRLPSNVTTVTSQGITVKLRTDEIVTFIPELAAWVHGVNPHNARLPGAVMSPELSTGILGGGGGCCAG